MNRFIIGVACALPLSFLGTGGLQQSKPTQRTFVADVAPIVEKYCLPCHLAENENPSGLQLDTYETLIKGGEKGKPIVPGKPDESIFYTKLSTDPPFGKQMPRGRRKMTEEDIQIIKEWIEQGAKKE